MGTVVIDGMSVAVGRRGAGPPLLLVHGLGGPAMWERVVPILAERFDVILPHLPGFGESHGPPRPLKARDHAAILLRAFESLGVGRATLAGISYGGEIAAAVAASRPDLVASLVLVCPTGTRRYPGALRSPGVRSAIRPFLRRGLSNPRIAERLSRRSFHDLRVRPADLVARHLGHLRLPDAMGALLAAIDDIWSGDGGLARVVGGLAMPLTLVWGAEDRTVPLARAGPLIAARPDATMVVIPGSGHSVPLERPSELADAISAAATRHS